MPARTLLAFVLSVLGLAPSALAEGSCLYIDGTNFIRQVSRRQDVPSEFRSTAKCSDDKPEDIREPNDVELDGTVRATSFSTDLGRMEVRWQRKAEDCFGKSPSRAVKDAAAASNKAIKAARFAPEIKGGKRDWQIAFIDKRAALAQFPADITVAGHPGFMIPPSRIYIVTDFISGNCSGSPVADGALTQVLLHEIGHAIEFMLVGDLKIPSDRARSEGFASWFEQYSADFAKDIPKGSVTDYYDALAREKLAGDVPAPFDGSAQAYAVSALRFRAVVDRKGIPGLMQVYQAMRDNKESFDAAMKSYTRWSEGDLHREMVRLLRSTGTSS